MRPSKRFHVNKRHSARKFSKHAGRTARANIAAAPMRGGLRL